VHGFFEIDIPRTRHRRASTAASSTDHQSPSRILQRDECLYRVGEPAAGIYMVVSGALKSVIVHLDGGEQVAGFHTPGDIIGYDALVQSTRSCTVMALDTASVRSLPPVRLAGQMGESAALAGIVTGLHHDIQRLIDRLQLERANTGQRVAAFLLRQARDLARRGYSESELVLPMPRRDLACFLGLAPETLCRKLSMLRRRGFIDVERNVIHIRDPAGLRAVAAGKGDGPVD